ncbi:hypothetical protein Sfulv_38750 [Streptomyces fulvorobeus]|uniref:Uncharacterized protein n=1 Tax=Streptomyces fulvorobeus TaxID=284028 RepID=A0A7J0CBA3_9ACTN|nr:hypothetical protein Sfulv_38750 [Streptomyces fulvorobeus]
MGPDQSPRAHIRTPFTSAITGRAGVAAVREEGSRNGSDRANTPDRPGPERRNLVQHLRIRQEGVAETGTAARVAADAADRLRGARTGTTSGVERTRHRQRS